MTKSKAALVEKRQLWVADSIGRSGTKMACRLRPTLLLETEDWEASTGVCVETFLHALVLKLARLIGGACVRPYCSSTADTQRIRGRDF